MPLLTFKDHWMLCDEDIEFNGRKHKNAFRSLDSLVKDGTLKSMTIDEKSALLNILHERKLTKQV